MAINTRNSWWSFISNDAGLLHATLATWALYGMLVQEDKCDFRVQKLRHKTEAIKEINTKIGSPGNQISDELVGTVATLANFEVRRDGSRCSQIPLLKFPESPRRIRRGSAPHRRFETHDQSTRRLTRLQSQRRPTARPPLVLALSYPHHPNADNLPGSTSTRRPPSAQPRPFPSSIFLLPLHPFPTPSSTRQPTPRPPPSSICVPPPSNVSTSSTACTVSRWLPPCAGSKK